LQELRFSSVAKQLTYLDIRNNNFPEQNLSLFSHLVNLEELRIGNDNQVKIRQGIYNRFYGSLEPLKDLTKLNELNIDNTDIDSGVKYLSKSLSGKYKKISCSTQARPRSKVKEIKEQLKLFADEEEQRL
jgi:Leucine-rich repeat (LRR) protein